ncbi:S-methyl-5'-thioadenosine phosphorylase, partial [bacterium]
AGASERGLELKDGGVYLNLNGPRYETPREVRTFGTFGADVVGMTAGTEAVVMRETGVPYALVAVVTNLGTGLSATDLHHGEVEDVMKARGGDVVNLLLGACTRLVAA